jgi:drug/metabolite transporter (DMT)-like permease
VRGFLRDPGVRLRFAALLLSATEAVFLKRALHGASPTTAFAWWAVLGLPIAFAGVFAGLGADARSQFGVFRAEFRTFALLALTTGVMQWTTLVSFGRMQVGYALALFQLSAVVSVLLGHRFFREGQAAGLRARW